MARKPKPKLATQDGEAVSNVEIISQPEEDFTTPPRIEARHNPDLDIIENSSAHPGKFHVATAAEIAVRIAMSMRTGISDSDFNCVPFYEAAKKEALTVVAEQSMNGHDRAIARFNRKANESLCQAIESDADFIAAVQAEKAG